MSANIELIGRTLTLSQEIELQVEDAIGNDLLNNTRYQLLYGKICFNTLFYGLDTRAI